MMAIRTVVGAAAGLLLSACGSIELPTENYWRLDVPAAAGGELPRGGVLRVDDLQLGNSLSGDHLLIAVGPAQLVPRELDRWVAPLDRLVTDALLLGLSRSRMFDLVKSAADPGGQDLTLHGRVVDFAEHRDGDADADGRIVGEGRAALAFWLERDGRVLFQDEFAATVPIGAHHTDGAEAAVEALSRALQQVLDELTGRMKQVGVFAAGVEAAPGK